MGANLLASYCVPNNQPTVCQINLPAFSKHSLCRALHLSHAGDPEISQMSPLEGTANPMMETVSRAGAVAGGAVLNIWGPGKVSRWDGRASHTRCPHCVLNEGVKLTQLVSFKLYDSSASSIVVEETKARRKKKARIFSHSFVHSSLCAIHIANWLLGATPRGQKGFYLPSKPCHLCDTRDSRLCHSLASPAASPSSAGRGEPLAQLNPPPSPPQDGHGHSSLPGASSPLGLQLPREVE